MFGEIRAWLCDAIAPRRCAGCDVVTTSAWCASCGTPTPAAPARVADVPLVSAGYYEGALAKAIRRFKYEPRPELAYPLAALLFDAARGLGVTRSTLWVPVPLHYERLVERGFNQAALIANELARATGTHTRGRVLVRRRETRTQAKLARAERQLNVRTAFRVRDPAPQSVILVDDVSTTGATAAACIEALRAKGVDVRAMFTLARTETQRRPPTDD